MDLITIINKNRLNSDIFDKYFKSSIVIWNISWCQLMLHQNVSAYISWYYLLSTDFAGGEVFLFKVVTFKKPVMTFKEDIFPFLKKKHLLRFTLFKQTLVLNFKFAIEHCDDKDPLGSF